MADERQEGQRVGGLRVALSRFLASSVEYVGMAALAVSIFLMAFGVGVWAQDSISKADSTQDSQIAVLMEKTGNLDRRVTSIEDRLFGILLTSIGAVVASLTSSVFSIRTHRKVKERGMG